MSQTLLVSLGLLLLMMIAGTALLAVQAAKDARYAARVKGIRTSGYVDVRREPRAPRITLSGVVSALGTLIARSGMLSPKTVRELEQTLAAAGVKGSAALGLFVGSKLLMMVLMPIAAWILGNRFNLSPLMHEGLTGAAAVIGLLAPDWWVGRQHKKYVEAVAVGLPDALDMMVICAEAGLSFEPSITRVALEIRHAHAAVAEEFSQTASELRVVADSRIALLNMGGRTGLDSLKRMGSMLAQTMQYGTPLGEALRVLSAEMRHETLMRFEERAARLPVLMTVPMILFILPCIFMIVGGPAAVQVMKTFAQ
jgi:tight adherence protein C